MIYLFILFILFTAPVSIPMILAGVACCLITILERME